MTDFISQTGVYYRQEDYAGFWKRCIAWLIDLTVILLFVGLYGYLVFSFIEDSSFAVKVSFSGSLLSAYAYLAILKSSRFKTLGFKVAHITIVDLKGEKPSWSTMLVRFLLMTLGPFTLLYDLLWLTGETTRQTLRDKYMGTYVIKNDSTPLGMGKIRSVRLDFMGWHLIFRETIIPENQKRSRGNRHIVKIKKYNIKKVLEKLIYINLMGTLYPLYILFISYPASTLDFIRPGNGVPLWTSTLFWLYLLILFFPLSAIILSLFNSKKDLTAYRAVNIILFIVIFISIPCWLVFIFVTSHL